MRVLDVYLSTLGKVYLGKDIRTEQEYALKIESIQGSESRFCREYEVYRAISGTLGIPTMHWYRKEGSSNVIVLDRLGLSVADLARQHKLNMKTIFSVADQMVCGFC